MDIAQQMLKAFNDDPNLLKFVRLMRSNSLETYRIVEKPSVDLAMLVREFVAKNKTVIMPQSPYSSDLAPADFVLFPKHR